MDAKELFKLVTSEPVELWQSTERLHIMTIRTEESYLILAWAPSRDLIDKMFNQPPLDETARFVATHENGWAIGAASVENFNVNKDPSSFADTIIYAIAGLIDVEELAEYRSEIEAEMVAQELQQIMSSDESPRRGLGE